MNEKNSSHVIQNRIETIDIIRGISLFGILMVNIWLFSWSSRQFNSDVPFHLFVEFLVDTFFDGKFYPIFSFLFGLGLSIQQERGGCHSLLSQFTIVKRLLCLFGFGVIHSLYFSLIDILVYYSINALLVFIFFRKAKVKSLVLWAFVMMTIVSFFLGTISTFKSADNTVSNSEITKIEKKKKTGKTEILKRGTFFEVARKFKAELCEEYFLKYGFIAILVLPIPAICYMPYILWMMLLGMAAGKSGVFKGIETKQGFWRKVMLITLPLGLSMSLCYNILYYVPSWIFDRTAHWSIQTLHILVSTGNFLAMPLLALGYISSIVLLSQRFSLLGYFASAGRMSLTNYLSQSIMMGFLYYGYGLGGYNQGSVFSRVITVFQIYFIQVIVSLVWFKYFNLGPFEWVWRNLTYFTWHPFWVGKTDRLKTKAYIKKNSLSRELNKSL